MKVETLPQLRALVKTARKLGLKSIEVDGLKIELGATPLKSEQRITDPKIEDRLSEEQIMFWSGDERGQDY